MQAFAEFQNMSADFWAFIKFISEMLGYTQRKQGTVRSYSLDEIQRLCQDQNVSVSPYHLRKAMEYCEQRANLLNNLVQDFLMDAKTARNEYHKLLPMYEKYNYRCKIPLNKQSGEMKQVAYFTAIINILAEKTIKRTLPRFRLVGI